MEASSDTENKILSIFDIAMELIWSRIIMTCIFYEYEGFGI